MSSVVSRVVAGNPTLSHGPEGYSLVEHYIVSDLDENLTDYQKMAAALNDALIPKRGDLHPDESLRQISPNLKVVSKTVDLVNGDNGVFMVTVNYKNFEAGDGMYVSTLQLGSTLQETEVSISENLDAPGYPIPIRLHYKKRVKKADGGETEVPVIQNNTATKQIPQMVFTITRREPGYPVATILKYQGKTNKLKFLEQDPGTLLLTNINAQSDDGGETCMVTYEFQRSQIDKKLTAAETIVQGWDVEIVARDSSNGQPIYDVVNPYERFQNTRVVQAEDGTQKTQLFRHFTIYERVDFNLLRFGTFKYLPPEPSANI